MSKPLLIEEGQKSLIKEIAEKLAYNYWSNSFGEDIEGIGDFSNIINEGQIDKFTGLKNIRPRNILIIGAGASHDSYSSIPLGNEMLEALESKFISPYLYNSASPWLNKYREEKDEIEKLLKGDLDFENRLYLISKFTTQEELREEIKLLSGFKYSPCLFYEIVAHLLKHSFIDVVINFNFDELLDNTILEEIGKDNFHYVISDGDAKNINEILINGRLKSPLYIKPHGTISHKSSLRFTKRAYLDISQGIKTLMKNIFNGFRGDKNYINEINLITVGFDLASVEFNDLLNEELIGNTFFYHFLMSKEESLEAISAAMKNRFNNDFDKFLDRAALIGNSFSEIYKPFNIRNLVINQKSAFDIIDSNKYYEIENNILKRKNGELNYLTSPFSQIFASIWRCISQCFNENNKPRSIARHELISYLFFNKTVVGNKFGEIGREFIYKRYENCPEYFQDRIIVEIAIHLLRNEGNIDMVDLLKGRAGIYYEKYKSFNNESSVNGQYPNSIYEMVSQYSKDSHSPSFAVTSEFEGKKLNFRILPSEDGFKNSVKNLKKYYFDAFKEIITENLRKQVVNKTIDFFPSHEQTIEFVKKYYDSFIDSLLKNSIKESAPNSISLHILFKMLSSPYLSKDFRKSLCLNYDKLVHNALEIEDKRTLIDELVRIFNKTSSSFFFNINAKTKDSRFQLWESYSDHNVLHSNMLLSNHFRRRFFDSDWDCLLAVFETGETFKKLISSCRNNDFLFQKLKKKKIILICSYESVDQLQLVKNSNYRGKYTKNKKNPSGFNDERIRELQDIHIDYLLGSDNSIKASLSQLFTIVLVPYWEHNQHCSIFLQSQKSSLDYSNTGMEKQYYRYLEKKAKSLDIFNWDSSVKFQQDINNGNRQKEYHWRYLGGYHMYKRGFSNTLNPLFIYSFTHCKPEHLSRDIDKLLLFFFNLLCRGIMYQVQSAPKMTYPHEIILDDFTRYKSWSDGEVNEKLNLFLGNIYLATQKLKYSDLEIKILNLPVKKVISKKKE